MKPTRLFYALSPFLFALVLLAGFQKSFAQEIIFEDSDPETMTLSNGVYEISIRKTNGSIAYISDQETGRVISRGSRNECLWGANNGIGGVPSYIGGCNFDASAPLAENDFSYEWHEHSQTLELNYGVTHTNQSTATHVYARVIVSPTTSTWFDMQLELTSNWNQDIDFVLFPSDMLFEESEIQHAYLAELPGIEFNRQFFEQDLSYLGNYPAPLFADYLAIELSFSETKTKDFAMYSIYQNEINPVTVGYIHDDESTEDMMYVYHAFHQRISDGDSWVSPVVRVMIDQPVAESLEAYRTDNRIDLFKSLKGRLAANYRDVAKSPLIKADAQQLGVRFSDYEERIFEKIPSPGIFHLVTYWDGDFDENYPNFFPPGASYGNMAELVQLIETARQNQLYLMPYINPTWWDTEAPQSNNWQNVALVNERIQPTKPLTEAYAGKLGYVVSPYAPAVMSETEELIDQLTNELKVPIIFEDQIGARPPIPAGYSLSPADFVEGWLQHTHQYSQTLLMTERGYDRLGETEVGFHGSLLLSERSLNPDSFQLETDTWRYYPLAPMLMRDKVLFYQHDLAPQTMTTDVETLMWNLAMGYQLSYDLFQPDPLTGQHNLNGGLSSEWLDVVALMQAEVMANYADERLLNFESLDVAGKVTKTSFENYSVVANWNNDQAYQVAGHTLGSPEAIVSDRQGRLIAGIFTTFNGRDLSAGEHVLIVHRLPHKGEIIVKKPLGQSTPLSIEMLSSWVDSDEIVLEAYNGDAKLLSTITPSIENRLVSFTYDQTLLNDDVAYYKIIGPVRNFLSLITNP